MKASRNTVRLHRTVHAALVWEDLWEDFKEWARRNITNEKVAEVGLVLATAVLICYLGTRLHVGLQNCAMFAY